MAEYSSPFSSSPYSSPSQTLEPNQRNSSAFSLLSSLFFFFVFVSLRLFFVSKASVQDSFSGNLIGTGGLDYDFNRSSCPDAEKMVRSTMAQIYSKNKDVSPALFRLFFHDCFVHGCDTSILLDDSFGNKIYSIEKRAVLNKTLRGFDTIDLIKEELERVCPGVVSCADILSLATRDGIILAGGPLYPGFTCRRDSVRSYHDEALVEIPKPDVDLPQILHLFSLKCFNEGETEDTILER